PGPIRPGPPIRRSSPIRCATSNRPVPMSSGGSSAPCSISAPSGRSSVSGRGGRLRPLRAAIMPNDLDEDIVPEPDAKITPSVRFREPLDLVVMVKSDGMRLDQYVLLHLGSNFSRSEVQRAIESGGVTVNARPSKPSYKVRKNDRLHVEMPEPTHEIPVPENIPIDVLFQDEWLAV